MSTIVLSHLSNEQLIELHKHYKKEDMLKKERLKKANPQRYQEVQACVEFFRKDIMQQLRKNLISVNKSHKEEITDYQ